MIVGNGGFFGGVNWFVMGIGFKYGFVVMFIDIGYNLIGIDMVWVVNKLELKKDWVY